MIKTVTVFLQPSGMSRGLPLTSRAFSQMRNLRTMSQQSRERVRERFDLKRQTGLLENIYSDVIAEDAGGKI